MATGIAAAALMTGACDRNSETAGRLEERREPLREQPMGDVPSSNRDLGDREGMAPVKGVEPTDDNQAADRQRELVRGLGRISDGEDMGHTDTAGKATPLATAELKGADGQQIEGAAKFYDSGNGIRIVADIEDATPGKHGIHVHERGDCSDIAGKSMGDHFNPKKDQHALPAGALERHLGDLGNIDVGADGKGHLDITVPHATLKENDTLSFLGKALIIHAGEDQGKQAQPAGGAGTPIACGAIEKF